MKLVNRKTRKAIEKSVRKAMKKHGPKLVAALAGSLATSIATLASTESADAPGKSNLGAMVDRAKDTVAGGSKGVRARQTRRERRPRPSSDLEGTQPDMIGADARAQ